MEQPETIIIPETNNANAIRMENPPRSVKTLSSVQARLRVAECFVANLSSPFCQEMLATHQRCIPEQGAERKLLAARLYTLRRTLTLTVQDVHYAADIPSNRLHKIEYGFALPTVPEILRLARLYRVATDELLEDLTGSEIGPWDEPR